MNENEKFEFDEINQGLIDYYGNPGDHRTLQELAKDLGCDYSTLYRRERKYQKQIFEAANKKLKDNIPQLRVKGYKSLDAKLNGRSTKPLEMLFKMTGDLVERVEQVTSYETVEQKRDKIAALLKNAGLEVRMTDKDASIPPNSTDNINTNH